MTDSNPSTKEKPTTSTGRLAHSLLNRRLGTLVSELVMVIAGILIVSASVLDQAESIVKQTEEMAQAIVAARDGGGAA